MANCQSPTSERNRDTRRRLEGCWKRNLDWEKYPQSIKLGCYQAANATSVPPAAILAGLLILCSFVLSPALVKVPNTDWEEPPLLWLIVNMPTGSRKTTVYQFLRNILQEIRDQCDCTAKSPPWMLHDSTFEKMGVLMHENGGRLLGLFDELTAFLTKIRLYNTRGITDSHELAMFLELYNANPWTRITVTGEANFSMNQTSLTVGGFNQPSVARNLIELPGNAEKGLSQRFLWLSPKPVYNTFSSLGKVNRNFVSKIVKTLAKQWRKAIPPGNDVETIKFSIPEQTQEDSIFKVKYDQVQKQLESIAGMDDLLSGMLSKSMGQILRVSAAMHLLFHIDKDDSLPSTITETAIKCAIDFVEVCCQHTAYLTGRGNIEQELKLIELGAGDSTSDGRGKIKKSDGEHEQFVLTMPGKTFDVSHIVNKKKWFRNRNGRDGAILAMKNLQRDGLGELREKGKRGSHKVYEFTKVGVPDNQEKLTEMAGLLQKYNVSLLQYTRSLAESNDDNGTEDIKTSSKSPGKRGTSQKSSPSKKLREDITDKS